MVVFQVPVNKEPIFTIPGTPGIVQHEILNNRRHVLTKVIMLIFSYVIMMMLLFKVYFDYLVLLSNCMSLLN